MPLSEPGFRALAETTLDSILTIDESSVIVYANPATEQLFGWSPDELVGKPLTTLMPPGLQSAHLRGIERYLATGEKTIPWSGIELPARHRDGRELRVQISFTHLRTRNGSFFAGIIRDVTERGLEMRRNQASHAVARVLARLPPREEAIHEVMVAICTTLSWQLGEFFAPTPDGESLVLRTTWQAEDLPLDGWVEATRAARFGRGVGLPGRVWETGEAAWIEEIAADPNFPRAVLAHEAGLRSAFAFRVGTDEEFMGAMSFLSLSSVSADDPLLQVMETVGAQLGQYLARRKAEEQLGVLLERERQARQLAERSHQRAAFLSEASRLLAESVAYRKTVGAITRLAVPFLADYAILYLLEGERPRRVAFAHVDPEREPLVARLEEFPVEREFFERNFAGGPHLVASIEPSTLDRYVSSEEHLRVLEMLAPRSGMFVPLAEHGGELTGGIALAYTDSGRRYTHEDLELARELAARCALALENARLYREARDATLARDELLAVVSHDLRNLLNVIALRAHPLATADDRLIRERHANVLRETVDEMAHLIEDLLEMSRADAGALELNRTPVEPVALLRRAATKITPDAGDRELVVTLPEELPLVVADPTRIGRVLDNLVVNALRHTPAGTRVELHAAASEGYVVLSVRDSGPGVPEEERERVFERYWRRGQSDGGGAGLGLSIARSLVEAHGGRIWIESSPTGGASFCFTLPQAPEAA